MNYSLGFPSTQTSRGNVRYFRKPRYISKRKAPLLRVPAIQRQVYGRTIVQKLSRLTVISADIAGEAIGQVGLVAALQASNDWANFAGSYSLFNILNVTVTIIPGAFSTADGHACLAGICYDPKDNVAISSYGSISDHMQYTFFTYSWNSTMKTYFKFKPKPCGVVPQRVTDATENFGWIKHYSKDTEVESGAVYTFIYTFNVVFSGQE